MSGANCDASAKRPGQRRKELTSAAGYVAQDREVTESRNGSQVRREMTDGSSPLSSVVRVSQGSVETRRGRAIKRAQSHCAGNTVLLASSAGLKGGGADAAEGHVEAVSGVAQLSIHSTSTAARDTRQP